VETISQATACLVIRTTAPNHYPMRNSTYTWHHHVW